MYLLTINFILFIAYSFLGWCCEVVYCFVGEKKFTNRGFLNGPICPIYGFGAMLVIYLLEPFINNIPLLFIFGIIITSSLEYITSYLMELIFKTRWWDYSDYKFNINGRVCLKNSFFFGFLSLVLMLFINPIISGIVNNLSFLTTVILASVLGAYFALDIVLTLHTMFKFKASLEKIKVIMAEIQTELESRKKERKEAFREQIENGFELLADKTEQFNEKKEQINEHLADKLSKLQSTKTSGEDRYQLLLKKLNNTYQENSFTQRRILNSFPKVKSNRFQKQLDKITQDLAIYKEEKRQNKIAAKKKKQLKNID